MLEAASQTSADIDSEVDKSEVEQVIEFLRINNLVEADEAQQQWYRTQRAARENPGWFSKAAKSYLFFRVPLWNPDKFLAATLPFVGWLGSKRTLQILLLCMLFGLGLMFQQLDSFLNTFLHFFNFAGLGVYLVALLFVKILHELGHAFTAKAMGCKVSTIGVAFLVGWPVLYTDTSDAWKIPSSRKRMNIGIAGVAVELAIASLALLLWSISEEGVWRSIFFLLATTSWLLSILVNFNPLMRFDGYYLLSDWLGEPNLEPRSFAISKWWLREKIFGFNYSPPENPQPKLIVYAFAVWIYRFFLFLGIALLVYHFFFKAAGIILFLIEIAYFIGRPLFNEIKVWWKCRYDMKFNLQAVRAIVVLAGIVAFGSVPASNSMTVPALMEARYSALYSSAPGKLKSFAVTQGQRVEEGQVLAEIQSKALEYELLEARNRYQELKTRREVLGFDSKMRSEALVVASELHSQGQKLRGLLQQRQELLLIAPHGGTIVDIQPQLYGGDWIGDGTKLFAVLDNTQLEFTAYYEEQQLSKVLIGARGVFYPEEPAQGSFQVEVADIDSIGESELDNLYMASLFGGNIAVREGENRELLTIKSIHKVKLNSIGEMQTPNQVLRGVVVLDTEGYSLFTNIYRLLHQVLRRELGF